MHNITESFNILLYVSFRICVSENEYANSLRKLLERGKIEVSYGYQYVRGKMPEKDK